MKNNRASKLKLMFLIIILLHQFTNVYAQLGKSCPPCRVEKNELDDIKGIIKIDSFALTLAKAALAAADSILFNVTKESNAANDSVAFNCVPGGNKALCAYYQTKVTALIPIVLASAEVDNRCIKTRDDVLAKLNKDKIIERLRQRAYDSCMARPTELCQKCDGGKVVADNSIVLTNPCEVCVGGYAVNNDAGTSIPPCTKCVNKTLVYSCPPTDTCCNGVCKTKKYSYTVTTIVTTCKGDSPPVVKSFITTSPDSPKESDIQTGKLFYSYGKCSGGSITKIHTTAPVALPPCD